MNMYVKTDEQIISNFHLIVRLIVVKVDFIQGTRVVLSELIIDDNDCNTSFMFVKKCDFRFISKELFTHPLISIKVHPIIGPIIFCLISIQHVTNLPL